MDRTQFHHSRHLVQYADDLVDGTCSLHCLAISLSLNIDREPKAIWAADFGAERRSSRCSMWIAPPIWWAAACPG
jgi:copper chaperone NosL